MFSDLRKNKILRNYYFELFEDKIHNTNKTRYINFHRYTKAKSESILPKERKSIKTNIIPETKKSKDKSSGAANDKKKKESNQKKKDQNINNKSRGNKN